MTPVIDFQYDFQHDIVIARPRGRLESKYDVMRWYEVHSRYFRSRFHGMKDLVTVNDALDVAPSVVPLWESYRATLHENFIRFSVLVRSGGRPRPASGVHTTLTSTEVPTVADAIDAIMAIRAAVRSEHLSGALWSPRLSLSRRPTLAATEFRKPTEPARVHVHPHETDGHLRLPTRRRSARMGGLVGGGVDRTL